MKNIFDIAPKPYLPKKLPLELNKILYDMDIIELMSIASLTMGEYKGFLLSTPNPMLLISPLLAQEAVLSSKLEGTHATLEDFLNFEAGEKTEIEKDELNEISNYRTALYYALENLGTINEENNKLPLSSRIIKEMHKILLSNVRGRDKNPGEFKRNQNYIGSNTKISYTPVPPDKTNEYMKNLEEYIHYEEKTILIQSAIIHAQFEMIHPFEDGNGRIGRLLIPLFLYYRDYLPIPAFYMSKYFEKDRDTYIKKLNGISAENNWKDWIKYYLSGVIEQAKISTQKAFLLRKDYLSMKEQCLKDISSKYIIYLLDFIFYKPVFKSNQVKEHFDSMKVKIGKTTIQTLLKKLVDLNFLESSNDKKNKLFYCPSILNNVND